MGRKDNKTFEFPKIFELDKRFKTMPQKFPMAHSFCGSLLFPNMARFFQPLKTLKLPRLWVVALGMFQVERFTAKAWNGCRRCDNGSLRGSLGITDRGLLKNRGES